MTPALTHYYSVFQHHTLYLNSPQLTSPIAHRKRALTMALATRMTT